MVRPSLASFLTTARAALHSSTPTPYTLLIGNEAADLDSLCSAILLAYIRTHHPASDSPLTTPALHIPIANIPRADFALRSEFAGVLRHVGLVPATVPSLSDVLSNKEALKAESTAVILVDHNALTGPLKELLANKVVGCIDHHVDERVVPISTGPEPPRIIETTGSCATLVFEYVWDSWNVVMQKQQQQEEVDAHLARLALAPIVIDTTNLGNAHKVTPRDIAAADLLEGVLRRSDASFSRDEYYNELLALDSDLSALTPRDILRKDYKQWEEDNGIVLGISAVVQPIRYISRSDGYSAFLDVVRAWAEEKSLDVAVVMTLDRPGDGSLKARELLVWGVTDEGRRAVKEFEAQSGEFLELQEWTEQRDGKNRDGLLRTWKQGNLAQSRKQVAPLLRDAISAIKEKL